MNLQIIVNMTLAWSHIILLATGFALIFYTARFFHFSHGIVFVSGAYFTFLFCDILELPLSISIILAVLASMFLGSLIEIGIYRVFRRRGSSGFVLLLASLGVYILLQNIVSIIFGDKSQSIRTSVVQQGINVLGARITPIQIITICLSVLLVIVVSLFLKKTKIGSSMRAVANDPELADVSGIDSDCVILWAFAIGSGVAGLAGILVALDVDMTPTMGMHALMMGVVAVIIGGVNSIPRIALGALLLATAQHLGAWFIGSEWQDAIAFVILLLFLIFRPEGFSRNRIERGLA